MASILRTDSIQNVNTTNLITQTNATTITLGASGNTITTNATLQASTINNTSGTTIISQTNATTITLGASGQTVALGSSVSMSNFKSTGITDSASTTALTIYSNKYVGIGINSPGYPLTVNNTNTPQISMIPVGGSNGLISNIGFWSTFSNFPTDTGARRSADITSGYNGGVWGNEYLTFNVGNSGDAANLTTERMRIDGAGRILIGYNTSNGSSYLLQVNSQIFATSGTIATSDANYKTNVAPLSNALLLINKLNPISFNWKKHPIHNFDIETPTVGFLAQEVQTALANENYVNSVVKKSNCVITPEVKDKDGNIITPAVTEDFLGIAEGNMIAILTKAIQELNTQVTQLQSQIAALTPASTTTTSTTISTSSTTGS